MAARMTALGEITRFWLQARHGCLVDESVPVPVVRGHSDIDLVAVQASLTRFVLPGGVLVGPRLIVETKDEHDFDPKGLDFAKRLSGDVQQLGLGRYVPAGASGVSFSMLRQEHYVKAQTLFGTEDFDRVFVLHQVEAGTRSHLRPFLLEHRIHLVIAREVVADLYHWYQGFSPKAGLRHNLVGDLWHLLVGFCNLEPKNW